MSPAPESTIKAYALAPMPSFSTKATAFDWSSWAKNTLPAQYWNAAYLGIGIAAYYTWPRGYLETCKQLQLGWCSGVVLRNLAMMHLFYGASHDILYDKRLYGGEHKFNPNWPSEKQHRRDRFWTTVSFLIASAFEIGFMYALANNMVSVPPEPSIGYWVSGACFVVLFRAIHFYGVHRLIHPWRRTIFGVDVGQILYNNAHYLHHKSFNPGPWSGLSMHPIESTLYFTCVLPHFVLFTHPVLFLFNLFHCLISPIPGHHGFDSSVLLGQKFHFLHHSHFECNFGGSLLPLDALFGTYRAE